MKESNGDKVEKRDYGMDNLKFILIICVVFGHVIEEISMDGLFGILRAIIYSFHMPLFVFISGYFSKNMEKGYQNAIENYLIPYLIFNTIWTVLDKQTLFVDVFLPTYVFWYMLSLFLWKILTPVLIRIKGIFIFSILLAIYIGMFNEADRFLSISRTICFMPFFILGVLCQKRQIEKIRQIPHYICGIILSLTSFFVIYCQMNSILVLKMYENIQSYQKCGLSLLEGMFQRTLIFVIAMIMLVCLINLVTCRSGRMSQWGQRTACIYLTSSFCIKGLFLFFHHIGLSTWIYQNNAYAIMMSIIITVITLWICGLPKIDLLYKKTMHKIGNIIVRKS